MPLPRVAAGAVRAAAAPTRALGSARASIRAVRAVAGAADVRGRQRRVWSQAGRAHIEVPALGGPGTAELARRLCAEVSALDGVAWCQVNAVAGRLVAGYDEDRVGVGDLVARIRAVEAGAGVAAGGSRPERVDHPADAAPLVTQAIVLAADCLGLAGALAGRLGRLPTLPGSSAAAVALVDAQPRLRRLVESRLGPAGTDLALAVSNAVLQGLSQGTASLLVDAAQRVQLVAEIRARRRVWAEREPELCGPDRPAPGEPLVVGPRPAPLPAGPVERCADRAATGSLLGAGGLLGLTGSLDRAGQAILVGAPRAAHTGREAFAATLSAAMARRGVVPLDGGAYRRLDRLSAAVVDGRLLHGRRRQVLSAHGVAEGWTAEDVWRTAQRLMWEADGAKVGPPGRPRPRLRLRPGPVAGGPTPGPAGGAVLELVDGDRVVGRVRVGRELDPLAEGLLAAVRRAGLRLLLTADPSVAELAARADEVLPAEASLSAAVRRLQEQGEVVAVVSAAAHRALAAADVAITVAGAGAGPRGEGEGTPGGGGAPGPGRAASWAADLVCTGGLADVCRLVEAAAAARSVSARGVTLALGGTALGTLLLVTGTGRGGLRARPVLPVAAAAATSLATGTLTGWRAARRPDPEPVLHVPWHALEPADVLARLGTGQRAPDRVEGGSRLPGLAAAHRLSGSPLAAPVRVPLRTAAQLAVNVRAELADPLTPVLSVGAAASAILGSTTDAVLVGSVMAANALVSGAQRLRADRALRALSLDQRLDARRLVPRADAPDGQAAVTVPAAALRPGDLIEVRAGEVVPADARLLAVRDLEVDESSLTGESVAVDKQVAATPGADLADRACMVYEGTTVLAGTGRAVVVAVGGGTEAGRALAVVTGGAPPAGVQARLEELTRKVLPVTLAGGAAVTGLALLRLRRVRTAVASGVGIAVAAVPEGLPLVATVAQLAAARRLSRRGVLVRSSRTVEALGRVDTVCFDKTGTLTEGRLRLARVADLAGEWDPADRAARRVLRAAARACPRPAGGQPVAHATDQAILDAAAQVLGGAGEADWADLAELAFESSRGYSAGLGRKGGSLRLVVKGAPEVLLPRCTRALSGGSSRPGRGAGADRPGGAPGSALAPFDGPARAAAQLRVERLARQGLRVLAVARRNLDHPPEDLSGAVDELTLLGFVALADLPRPAARPLVRQLTAAGIRTVMLTGDHPVTARAVAGRLGIPDRRVVTGAELAALDEAGRRRLVGRAEVFARVSPEQKVHVVDALRKAGRVVAMTGDGVNDAAAIRLADVGIGIAARGSASARTAADLVLARPDVSLVVDALVEGRAMWSRVRDAVAILVGGNAGEVAFTLLGTALSGRAPLGTRQFLLVNLLTDMFPAMAVALSPRRGFRRARGGARPEPALAPGRPALGRPLLATVGIRGAATAAGTTAAWLAGRLTGGPRGASSMALATLVATQLGQTLLVGGRSPLVVATVVGTGAALTAIVQVPGVSHFFGCTPLDPLAWATVLSCAAAATVAAAVLPPLVRRVGGRARGPLPAWLAAFGEGPVAGGPRPPSPAAAVTAGTPT